MSNLENDVEQVERDMYVSRKITTLAYTLNCKHLYW